MCYETKKVMWFTLLRSSRAEPTIPVRYACTWFQLLCLELYIKTCINVLMGFGERNDSTWPFFINNNIWYWISCVSHLFLIVEPICLVNSYINSFCFLLSYLTIFTFYAWLIFKWYKYWVTFVDVGTLSWLPPTMAFLLITLSDTLGCIVTVLAQLIQVKQRSHSF